MTPDLQQQLLAALERPHRLGTIGGDLEEQLAHSASFSSVLAEVGVAPASRGIDLGTGGGLPGIVIAGLWPAMSWTLVDLREARATEVERSVLRLGYRDRVTVVAGDAQTLGHAASDRQAYDVAVARAFGPPSITAECAAGVVAVGGVFVVSEPPHDADDDAEDDAGDGGERWNEASLVALGFDLPEFLVVGGYRFAVLRKVRSTAAKVPRLPARANRGWYVSRETS